jgi:hypothetical protein
MPQKRSGRPSEVATVLIRSVDVLVHSIASSPRRRYASEKKTCFVSSFSEIDSITMGVDGDLSLPDS